MLLACSSMDTAVGKCTYTSFLNSKGGIAADITVTRFAKDHFRLISGAATRWRDLAALRRAAAGYSVNLTDVTESEAVIGVMGQGSRELLTHVSDDDWQTFAFATSRQCSIGGKPVRAQRTSFVGELGWELYISKQFAGSVFDMLTEAGAKPMGHYALESCRIEKGFRHWGHDIGPDTLLAETGLPVKVDWNKSFNGKQALLQTKQSGVDKRLCLLQLDGKPLPLHDEPVHEGQRIVGLTTSGTRGVRTGLTLAFAYIDTEVGETIQQTATRQFEVDIAGIRYPAKVLQHPPFDPFGDRMRS